VSEDVLVAQICRSDITAVDDSKGSDALWKEGWKLVGPPKRLFESYSYPSYSLHLPFPLYLYRCLCVFHSPSFKTLDNIRTYREERGSSRFRCRALTR
jgi:hypothetical protein